MASRPLRSGDPRRLGSYRLLARLGEGGMGTVFLARDPHGQHVAVKAIRPEFADNEEFRARFRSEVNRARQVPSFCTAAVLDADPDDETPYLVVEYVDGPSLQEMVDERGPMSAGDLHSVAVGVAVALTAIHGAGVVHRDLKPLNVLLSLGLPKVIDFGIARALEATNHYDRTTGHFTRTGHWMGTVDYMAPERLDPAVGEVTAAADIFAWGGVIAFAGMGGVPFRGDTPMATAAQILTKEPDLRGVPASLNDLVERALTKDPRDRPTANELVHQLLAVSAPSTGPEQAQSRGAKRRRPAAAFDARELLEQVIAEAPKPVSPPPDGAKRPPAARFDVRELLAQVIAEAPKPVSPPPSSPVSPPPPSPVSPPPPSPVSPPASSPVDGPRRPPAARFDARELLEQVISEAPTAEAAPATPHVPRLVARRAFRRAERGRRVAATRRLIYAVGALLVASVTVATVAYARTNGETPAADPTVETKIAPATTAASMRGPSFFDPLRAPGRFRESSGEHGGCKFRSDQLHARVDGRSTYQCPGPDDVFSGDQTITFDLDLASDDACAMVWFRYHGDRGYQMTACADQVELEELDGAILTSIGKAESDALRPGDPHEVSIVIANQHATVTIDGKPTAQAAVTDPDLFGADPAGRHEQQPGQHGRGVVRRSRRPRRGLTAGFVTPARA